ncbi:MAG: hypothetical protein PVJ69_08365 [Desulfobacteraceae bacterium]|jgi:PAS domain-containing protein
MPLYLENEFDPSQRPLVLDQIAAAITVIDLEGRTLYYNDYSAQVLDRKPEYLGKDVRLEVDGQLTAVIQTVTIKT